MKQCLQCGARGIDRCAGGVGGLVRVGGGWVVFMCNLDIVIWQERACGVVGTWQHNQPALVVSATYNRVREHESGGAGRGIEEREKGESEKF